MGKSKEEAPIAKKPSAPVERASIFDSPWEREIERWFDDFRHRFGLATRAREDLGWPFGDKTSGWGALDVFDKDGDIVVKADLPGVAKEDVEVTLTGNRLTVRATKKHETEVKKEQYFRSERTFGEVSRSVELPAEVELEKANANFKDGVLEVRLPKTPAAKAGPRTLEIS